MPMGTITSMKDRTITVNGVSKGFAMTGWRVGFIGAPLWVAKACNKIQGQITSATCAIAQKAAEAAMLANPKEVTVEMKATFLRRRNMILNELNSIKGIKCNVPQGAFYVFPDISFYFGKSVGNTTINNANDFCMYLLNKAHVAFVAGDAFGNAECVRVSYAAADDKLMEAMSRIKKQLAKLELMDFNTLFQGFNEKKVLIVGDSMIDAYMWGEINRISPEAPVPVVEIKKHENRLGGAANVALNLKSLGASPILCSVIGTDKGGEIFQELMQESKLSTAGILCAFKRKTTIKTRIIADNKHQLRVDEEQTFPILEIEEFLKLTLSLMNDVDVIILQDYNKGVLTPKIIEGVIDAANKRGIPSIVDPKNLNFNSYNNCTIFKPNLAEIKAGMKINFDTNNINNIEKSTLKLRKKLSAKGVLLTLSERGICINSEKEFKHTPAIS